MKVYISADIEGITGIAHWDEALPKGPDYAPWRERMAAEVQAVVRGARAGGATEVWVQDAHGGARNLRPTDLPDAHLVRGWSGHPAMMIQALDDTFDALLCVGYHSPAPSAGSPLAHTLCGTFAEVRVDGRVVSEFDLAAAMAASLGVPTLFLSGDNELCAAASESHPHLQTVPTHTGVGLSVEGRPLTATQEALEHHARLACSQPRPGTVRPLAAPLTLSVRFKRPMFAYGAAFYPGARSTGPDTAEATVSSWLELLTALKFWFHLST